MRFSHSDDGNSNDEVNVVSAKVGHNDELDLLLRLSTPTLCPRPLYNPRLCKPVTTLHFSSRKPNFSSIRRYLSLSDILVAEAPKGKLRVFTARKSTTSRNVRRRKLRCWQLLISGTNIFAVAFWGNKKR